MDDESDDDEADDAVGNEEEFVGGPDDGDEPEEFVGEDEHGNVVVSFLRFASAQVTTASGKMRALFNDGLDSFVEMNRQSQHFFICEELHKNIFTVVLFGVIAVTSIGPGGVQEFDNLTRWFLSGCIFAVGLAVFLTLVVPPIIFVTRRHRTILWVLLMMQFYITIFVLPGRRNILAINIGLLQSNKYNTSNYRILDFRGYLRGPGYNNEPTRYTLITPLNETSNYTSFSPRSKTCSVREEGFVYCDHVIIAPDYTDYHIFRRNFYSPNYFE